MWQLLIKHIRSIWPRPRRSPGLSKINYEDKNQRLRFKFIKRVSRLWEHVWRPWVCGGWESACGGWASVCGGYARNMNYYIHSIKHKDCVHVNMLQMENKWNYVHRSLLQPVSLQDCGSTRSFLCLHRMSSSRKTWSFIAMSWTTLTRARRRSFRRSLVLPTVNWSSAWTTFRYLRWHLHQGLWLQTLLF